MCGLRLLSQGTLRWLLCCMDKVKGAHFNVFTWLANLERSQWIGDTAKRQPSSAVLWMGHTRAPQPIPSWEERAMSNRLALVSESARTLTICVSLQSSEVEHEAEVERVFQSSWLHILYQTRKGKVAIMATVHAHLFPQVALSFCCGEACLTELFEIWEVTGGTRHWIRREPWRMGSEACGTADRTLSYVPHSQLSMWMVRA